MTITIQQGRPISREVLSADRTYYVRTDGSDSNTGLVDSAGGAFLTIQKAINVFLTLDLGGFAGTIQVRDGTYTGAVSLSSPFVGGNVTLQGNTTTPANCIISTTSVDAVAVSSGANLTILGFKIQTTTSGNGLLATTNGIIRVTGLMQYGTCAGFQIAGTGDGKVYLSANYTINGGALVHFITAGGGTISVLAAITVTVSGTPAFSLAFAFALVLGVLDVPNITFSGSATGTRYTGATNSVIFTSGGGASYFPGDAAGSVATGAQYA